MDALFLIGRFLFGLLFIVSGAGGHLAGYQQLTGYAAAKKIPFPGPAVLISGVGIIAGGIAIIVGIWADLAALGLAVFLFFTTFFIHYFWTQRGDPLARLQLRRSANAAAPEVVRRGRRRAVGSASPRSSTIWQGARARGVERAPPAGIPARRARARRRVARRSCAIWRTRRSDRGAAPREPRDLDAPAITEAGRPWEGAALRRRGSRDREALAHPPWDPAAHT